MSTYFDTRLTLSIPRNYLPLNLFHCHLWKHFDTLSVYRGSLCEQSGRARTTRSPKLQRLNRHEKSNTRNSSLASPCARKLPRSHASTLRHSDTPTTLAPSSLVKPGKGW